MNHEHFTKLREAIENSWSKDTAYEKNFDPENPSMNQCYVTSWVLQQYIPELEIYEGQVDTGTSIEKHFWTTLMNKDSEIVLDLTWQQFPSGSRIISKKYRDRETLSDHENSIERRKVLLLKVKEYLARD